MQIDTESKQSMAEQARVNQYFDSKALYWKSIYEQQDIQATIYQQRSKLALEWIESLCIHPGERVLELGCGAGLMSTSLARLGFSVDAVDANERMVDFTRQRAAELNLEMRVRAGDAHRLEYENEAFRLVVALGVLPWLHSPQQALQEVARVLRPGGFALLTADNKWRLSNLTDPALNPTVRFVWCRCVNIWESMEAKRNTTGYGMVKMHSVREFESLLTKAALQKMRSVTLGFGPFSFRRKQYVPGAFGLKLHHVLQSWASRGIFFFRSAGAQHIVLAKKASLS